MRGGAAGHDEFTTAFLSLSRRWFWFFVLGSWSLNVGDQAWKVAPLGAVMVVMVLLAVHRLRSATSGTVARHLGAALGVGVVAAAVVFGPGAVPSLHDELGSVGWGLGTLGTALYARAMERWATERGADELARPWRRSWWVASVVGSGQLVVSSVTTAWALGSGGSVDVTVDGHGWWARAGLAAIAAALVAPVFTTSWAAVRTGDALERQTQGAGVRPAEA